jgi:hypothetical protein
MGSVLLASLPAQKRSGGADLKGNGDTTPKANKKRKRAVLELGA